MALEAKITDLASKAKHKDDAVSKDVEGSLKFSRGFCRESRPDMPRRVQIRTKAEATAIRHPEDGYHVQQNLLDMDVRDSVEWGSEPERKW